MKIIREYNEPVIKKYKYIPQEKCDYCKKFQHYIFRFNPVITTHTFDDLRLCETCSKKIFGEEVVQMAKESTEGFSEEQKTSG